MSIFDELTQKLKGAQAKANEWPASSGAYVSQPAAPAKSLYDPSKMEFTPEINKSFYESMARPIQERENMNVGRARSEALSRGLEGDPFEAQGVSAARTAGTNALSDLWSNISMQGAGMARQERLTGEGQQWQAGQAQIGREFQSAESDKLRSFQERMAELDRANARRMGRDQGSGWGDVAGMAAGYFTGGLGAGLAKKIVG